MKGNLTDSKYSQCHLCKQCHFLCHLVCGVFMLLWSSACESLDHVQDSAVARVGDAYLYTSDITFQFDDFKDSRDSIVRVQNFINTWALEQLLYQQAIVNSTDEQKRVLKALVRKYEVELFGQRYKASLVHSKMDTLISETDLAKTYESNKAIFSLKEPIYKFRLLQLPKDNVDQKEIRKRFQRFDSLDRHFLDSLSFQFTSYVLGDSLWVSQKELFSKVPFINDQNVNRYFKKGKIVQVNDSLDVYLFMALDMRKANALAPMSYVSKTLKSIVLNQRKIEFLRNFDNELLQDAIRSKKYEHFIHP